MSQKIIDHKVLGKKLKLFFFYKNLNNGLPIWLPNGTFIYKKIINIISKINKKNKYEEVITPNIGNYSLFKKSGHIDKYLNNIFQIKYKKKIFLKPMNCPFHNLIYKFYNNISYKKLPIKFYEFGVVNRKEKSGELNGLFRIINFTQDDGHIYCLNEYQLINEINNIINIILYLYKILNFNKFFIRLSLRSYKKEANKYIGKIKYWKKSEKILLYIIKKKKIKYKIIYGEAAFYGPKLDFIIKDTLNRSWQLSTIQIDYNTPKKINISYINKKNRKKTPIMIHRAYIGSIERLIGILLENNKGILPIWLLKLQIVILPINNNDINYKYSKLIYYFFINNKIRCKIDNNNINLNKKIKLYEKIHIPIILIIGDKEVYNNTIFIRLNKKKIGILNRNDAYKYILEYIYNN